MSSKFSISVDLGCVFTLALHRREFFPEEDCQRSEGSQERIMDEEVPERNQAAPQDKLSVYAAVKTTCDEIGKNNSLLGPFSMEKEAVLLISELVYRKLKDTAEDVEAFAAHAKRNNINVEDVKLLFRKNQKILEGLKAIEDAEEKDRPPVKRKRGDTDPDPNAT